jgi:aldehyde dehydrogenase (NAD+)
LAETISLLLGAPLWLWMAALAAAPLGHLATAIEILKTYEFERVQGTTLLRREAIGVCGMITPWNWPVNQIACKVAPALAAGCTMVLKPSEIAPLSAYLWTQILDEAGVPAGVFNLVNGDGPTVGAAISSHPDVDMVSFTGSTRAGVAVATAAAPTVKRVTQELGGKSANILLEDVNIEEAVSGGVRSCFMNSGQSCNAPTRMLVSTRQHDEALAVAKATAESMRVGDPFADGAMLGPVVSEAQWDKIQRLIQAGIDEGADLVTGGPGRPEGLEKGYYVRPTVFGNVRNDMTIAREEIFGPVISILPYRDEAEAVQVANDTLYGLAGYVSSGDPERARRIAKQLRAGNVHMNGAGPDFGACFGGYKQSGNGREWGTAGFEEFLEMKAILGYAAA